MSTKPGTVHGSFRDQDLPPYPSLFARWTASLTVGGAPIPVPANEEGVDWEGEVMAYVGSTLVDATPEQALAGVVGYSPFNDVTSRRAQKLTSQWIPGKNGDSSGPLGPLVPAAESATCATASASGRESTASWSRTVPPPKWLTQ